ncbi:MAG: AbrB/MazE/SpoVT family DNA-binding domain-containing protein [Acidobacteriaceae bacterium]
MKPKSRKKALSMDHHRQDKIYGTSSIGAKGQIVIPAEARKDLDLKSGEKLMITGKFGKVLVLFKSEEMGNIIHYLLQNVDFNPHTKKELSAHLKQLLTNIKP